MRSLLLDYLSKNLLHNCGFQILYMFRNSLLFEPTVFPPFASNNSKSWDDKTLLETIVNSNIIMFFDDRIVYNQKTLRERIWLFIKY